MAGTRSNCSFWTSSWTKAAARTAPAWKSARCPAEAVYNGPQQLVVNKPAGLPVDGPENDTLLNRALLYLNKAGNTARTACISPLCATGWIPAPAALF